MAELPEGVSVEKLLKVYALHKKKMDKQAVYLQTEEGKQKNREANKAHYYANREKMLNDMAEKRHEGKPDKDAIVAKIAEKRRLKAEAKKAEEAAFQRQRELPFFQPLGVVPSNE